MVLTNALICMDVFDNRIENYVVNRLPAQLRYSRSLYTESREDKLPVLIKRLSPADTALLFASLISLLVRSSNWLVS
ncbi:MAG: hypothetical protein HW387_1736 [Parachlamydiales bacterium]|nr:hypothetical protein [Parachlamydiales bacterium]